MFGIKKLKKQLEDSKRHYEEHLRIHNYFVDNHLHCNKCGKVINKNVNDRYCNYEDKGNICEKCFIHYYIKGE